MDNLCACGCGTPTKPIGKRHLKHHKWVRGHHMMAAARERTTTKSYRARVNPDGMRGGTMLVHRQRAERALGKPLPRKAVVHHADGSRDENAQLVICEDQRYHGLLHVRMRVKAAGGNPNTDRICHYCQTVKPMDAFVRLSDPKYYNVWHCKQCCNERTSKRWKAA